MRTHPRTPLPSRTTDYERPHARIGNEADQYGLNGLRASNWTVQEYVPDWEETAGPVVEAVGIASREAPVTLQGAAFVSHSTFTPREIFALGILNSTAGKAIST